MDLRRSRRRALRYAHTTWLPATIVAAVLLATAPPATADRDPAGPSQTQVDKAKQLAASKAADVAAIQASLVAANNQVRAASIKAEQAAEAWNEAQWRLDEARLRTQEAQEQVAAAEAARDEQRAGIARLVAQSYQDGSVLNPMTAFIGAEGPAGVMQRVGVVNSATESMQADYDRYTATATIAELARQKFQAAEREQERLTERAAALRDDAVASAHAAANVAAGIAARRSTLLEELAEAQQVSLDLATKRQNALEKQAKKEAEEAARAEAKKAAKQANRDVHQAQQAVDGLDEYVEGMRPEGGWSLPGLPIPAGTPKGAAKAITFAQQQLGDPYLWGAAGPSSWDCSGLTMMAWRQGGIALPHYSAAQYQQTKHIGIADLQPGDLLFWGNSPNTIHHVALYIGNGMMLHAPRTGTFVRIESMYGWMPNFFGRP